MTIKDNQHMVSVILPVFNGEKYLKFAIESILNQTHKNFEFLIINDGSFDRSLEVISSYQDQRIKIINKSHSGHIEAYNAGFKNASSNFITIIDQDDICATDRIEKLLYNVIQNDLSLVGSWFNILNKEGTLITHREPPISHDRIRFELKYKNDTIFNPTIMIRKEVFIKYGYFDIKYNPSSDYEFYLRFCEKEKIANIPEYLYSWRINPNSISHSNANKVYSQTYFIAMRNLKKEEGNLTNGEFFYFSGLIAYYNNFLLKAVKNFIIALYKREHPRGILLYIFKSTVFAFPLKLARKFNLFNTRLWKF